MNESRIEHLDRAERDGIELELEPREASVGWPQTLESGKGTQKEIQ